LLLSIYTFCFPQIDIGHYLLFHLSKATALDGIIINSIIVSTRPGALYKAAKSAATSSLAKDTASSVPSEQLESLPMLKNYKGINFSTMSNQSATDYLTFLLDTADSAPTAARNSSLPAASPLIANSPSQAAHTKSETTKVILASIPGHKTPLMLLLAFAAYLQASERQATDSAQQLSRFMLYRTICSTSCERKLKEALERSSAKDELADSEAPLDPDLLKTLERLLTCYAMSIRLLPASQLARLGCGLEEQARLLFGGDAAPQLEADAKRLSELLGVKADAPQIPFLPYLLQKV